MSPLEAAEAILKTMGPSAEAGVFLCANGDQIVMQCLDVESIQLIIHSGKAAPVSNCAVGTYLLLRRSS